MKKTRRGERGSSGYADLLLIAVLLLMSSLALSSSQQLHQSTLLLQNQVHADRALLKTISNASRTLHNSAPQKSDQMHPVCSSATGQAGPIQQTLFRCDLFGAASPEKPPLINYQALLENAAPCPKRQHRHTVPQDWNHRSLFECDTPHGEHNRYAGDLFLDQELRIQGSSEQLILARGSLYIRVLKVSGPVTVVSLGDISIGTIIQAASAPASVLLIAPAGTAAVSTSQGPVYLAVAARADRVSPALPRLPMRPSRFLAPLPSLPLGIFPQALGVTP